MSGTNTWGAAPKFSSFKPRTPEPEAVARPLRENDSRPSENKERRYNHRHHRSRSITRDKNRAREEDRDSTGEHREKRHHHRSRSITRDKNRAREEDRDSTGEHREKRHHHRRRRSRSRSPESTQLVARQKPSSDESKIFDLPPFALDWKGDVQNLVYGRLHRYDVPPFHRIGRGNVVGVDRKFRIDRAYLEDEGIVLNDSRGALGLTREKYAFARNERKGSRLLKVRPENSIEDYAAKVADYIPLKTARKRKRRGSNSSTSTDEEKNHYRSIEGKAKAGKKPDDEALEYATESDSSNSESGRAIRFDAAIKLQSIDLSRRVDKNPQDIEAWLALIDHQDTLLGRRDRGHTKITNAEIQSTAEIKLDMYEKALKSAGSATGNRERLLIGIMEEGSKIWSPKVQAERWEQISQNDLDSTLLWKRYLDFRQTDFASFKYEEIRDLFQNRIKLLHEAIKTAKAPKIQGLFEQLIYTVLRATLLMREAGYTEIAVATWQALLEFNICSPSELNPSRSRLELFQEFWESEAPRIGEENASGWGAFVSSQTPDMLNSRSDEETPSLCLEKSDTVMAWTLAEEHRAGASKWPARTMDDTVEDDPFRVILWSDIEGFIFNLVDHPCSSDLSSFLIDSFLIFCRLPPLSKNANQQSRKWSLEASICDEALDWGEDYIKRQCLLQHEVADISPDAIKIDSKSDENLADDLAYEPFQAFSPNFIGFTDTLLVSSAWFKSITPWNFSYKASKGDKGPGGPVEFGFVRDTLKILAQTVSNDNLAEFYLAWMYTNQPQDIRKTAKGLIKQRPTSPRLYNAYSLIEWHRGNKENAENIFRTALTLQTSLLEQERDDCILLWRTRVWCLLQDGQNLEAMRCLLAIPDGSASTMATIHISSPATFMRAKQHLSSTSDYMLSAGNTELASLYTECLALLHYFLGVTDQSSRQGDIEASLAIFDAFSSSLASRDQAKSPFHELLHQSSARLLYHHVQTGPFRPALFRERMTYSLSLFPSNTIFLSLFAWNEARLRIEDRVRTLLRDSILTEDNDCVSSRLFAIRHELRIGNVHSVRSAFENAVSSTACLGNAGLWRLYVLWCAHTKEFRKSTKEVLYRGMRACPWAKKLMMTAFSELRDVMGFEELKSVYQVMQEKELRIHVDLEDWLEDHNED